MLGEPLPLGAGNRRIARAGTWREAWDGGLFSLLTTPYNPLQPLTTPYNLLTTLLTTPCDPSDDPPLLLPSPVRPRYLTLAGGPGEPLAAGKSFPKKTGGRFPVFLSLNSRFSQAGARTNPTRVWGTDRRGKSPGGGSVRLKPRPLAVSVRYPLF